MTSRSKKIKPRAYESAIRAEAAAETRQKIIDAARRQLALRGYAAMTMQAIADDAGVALDTVYATVGKKPKLIRLLVETAISNTSQEVPPEERDYVKRIVAATSAREIIDIYTAAVTDIHGRLAPLVREMEIAARSHPELEELWSEIAERRAQNMKKLAQALVRTGDVREELGSDEIADVVWATSSPELYTLLKEQRGWNPTRYRAWLADAWARLFLRSS